MIKVKISERCDDTRLRLSAPQGPERPRPSRHDVMALISSVVSGQGLGLHPSMDFTTLPWLFL